MTIYEQIKDMLKDDIGNIIFSSEKIKALNLKYGTNPSSIILSDYCYNRINDGIMFDRHIFEYIEQGRYKYLGENHPYTGIVIHKPKGSKDEFIVGEWDNGKLTMYEIMINKRTRKPIPTDVKSKINLIIPSRFFASKQMNHIDSLSVTPVSYIPIKLPTKEQLERALQPNVWDFGNKILYDMCRANSKHNKDDQILAKVLFIGRIYAAAVERRRNKKDEINDDFYVETIAPTFRNSKLDDLLNALHNYKSISIDSILPILHAHHYLTTILNKITDLNKRSFSSKYLHFHLPELFFIYDSRAAMGLRFFTSDVPEDLRLFTQADHVDGEYAKFFCKCLALKRKIENQYKVSITNRQLDNMLIEVANKKAVVK